MQLELEVDFLTGAYRGTHSPGADATDWPPQPDRLFSALVAAWGAQGRPPDGRQALVWLEAQPPPTLHSGGAMERPCPRVFVPTNDARLARADRAPELLPARRRRNAKPRLFPCAHLEDPILRVRWPTAPPEPILAHLDALAREVVYVGASTSLARCRFTARADTGADGPAPARATRTVYPGRLAELERALAADPQRPFIARGMPVYPPERPPVAAPGPAWHWHGFEIVSGTRPSLESAALVARAFHGAIRAGYARAGHGAQIPELVLGHTPDGRPATGPHLAIVPMAFVGARHATGEVFGFAVLVPPTGALNDAERARWATVWNTIMHPADPGGAAPVTLRGASLRDPLGLAPVGERPRWSLTGERYLASARRWATVTPIVLDRHLKRRDGPEAVSALVARSCQHAGIDAPEWIAIGRHSAVRGTPSLQPHRHGPWWTGWRMPRAFASRGLTHAVLEFDAPVAGPLVLGAGRHCGLGLCLPLPESGP